MRLIDADKLLDWLKVREERSLIGGLGQATFTLYDVESRIARGLFNADPHLSIKYQVSKQPNLIDGERLVQRLRRIEQTMTLSDDFYGGRKQLAGELADEITNGVYDPDPIPLPTIKPGDKVRHQSLGEVRINSEPTVMVLNGISRSEVYLSDLEVSHD